ncbi:hypothetical protein QOZ80_8AG0617850 [Eleusine coracana subsp. coracana]|nr:hypothetical protein QOZ80_8AG0617850 [Eleusine coracana subsp. coracana]
MANQRQRAKTASICTAETEESSHIFRISGYSHHIGLGVGRYISSTIFFVGGHGWRIRYFPEGEDREACEDFVAVYLDLVSVVATVRFKYNLKLVNKTTGESSSIFFSPNVLTAESPSSWGTNRFMKKSEIESTYMSDESVEIECDVTVIMESRLREIPIPSYFDFHVPPSNLSDDLHKLFESEEGVDITFKVKNEFFRAHKILLAIRSPVFKQQFYESLKIKRMESRTVDE